MPSYVSVRSRSGSRDGVALILVLACIVLLSILILSMISFTRLGRLSTASYSRSIQAQEIAQGGIQDILGDLHTEIVAGSVTPAATYISGSGSYARAYIPTNNFAAAPAHIGYDPTAWGTDINTGAGGGADVLSPTLLRVSRASQDSTITHFYPNIANHTTYPYYDPTLIGNLINRASASNTSTPSANGRAITWARWNKTFLIGCSSTTNEADSPYCMPGAFCFTNYPAAYAAQGSVNPAINPPYGPPDWVYVTRSGSRVCTNTATELPLLKPNSSVTTSYTVTPGQNPPASPIIGRYAYVVYDEGATLDVNAAGFYSSTPSVQAYSMTNSANFYAVTNTPYSNFNMTNSVTGKSYLPYADLSISSLLQSQANVNKFITWRNGSISSISNSKFQTAAFNYSLANFLSYSTGDSPLLSRQDLINYFASVDSTFNTDNNGSPGQSRALPYLGTFTRAVSAPSWAPKADSSSLPGFKAGWSSPVLYRTNMENSGVANRDLANVRYPPSVAAGAAITHYGDDATVAASTYNVNPGDPLLQSRFSLAKIAWLSQVDPNQGATATLPATYAAPIQSCFGLAWGKPGAGYANGGNPCWIYVGSANIPSTTPATSIETLDQVASEKREPNFFELLKAAILSGSLGLSPGVGGWSNGTASNFDFRDVSPATYLGGPEVLDSYSLDHNTATPSFPSNVPAPCVVSDIQIMKIGANIIDQFDADSYPTAIYFNYLANTSLTTSSLASNYDAAGSGPAGIDHTTYGEANMVFGDENLPYLMGAYLIAGAQTQTSTDTLHGWMQPQLWNPHQVPASFSSTTPQLTKFQIRSYGQADLVWNKEYTPTNPLEAKSGQTLIPTPSLLDGQYIDVTMSSTGNALLAANPQATVTSVGNANIVAGPHPGCSNAGYMSAQNGMLDYSFNQFVAFWLGDDPTFIVDPDTMGNGRCYLDMETSSGYSMSMGWLDGSGGYHPYDFMTYMAGYTYGVLGNEKNGYAPDVASGHLNTGSALPESTGDDAHFLVDPRTFRFGALYDWGSECFARPESTPAVAATTFYPNASTHPNSTYGWGDPMSPNFTFVNGGGTYASNPDEDFEVNQAIPSAITQATPTYYCDMDGVIRPGDGVYRNASSGGTGDGDELFLSNGATTHSVNVAVASGDTGNAQNGRRPVVLNRPFRNVGELGYAFRDLPFKTLDFFTQYSADAALLDVFSVTDEAQVVPSATAGLNQLNAVVAGRVNINNAPVPVITSLLSYGGKKDLDPSYDILPTSSTAAVNIVNRLSIPSWSSGGGVGPIASRADLVTQLGPILPTNFLNTTSADKIDKAYLESPIRALSNVTNARTWNLMIDIIAQSGELTPTATSLDNFVVQGEKRYWLHIAIDRYTGKIVDQQLEPVYE